MLGSFYGQVYLEQSVPNTLGTDRADL